MKKILLLLLFFYGIANSQVVTIPDAYFKTKLLASSPLNAIAYSDGIKIKIDQNSDGEIQLSEALVVDSLTVPSASINDLTGILAFSNLKKLDCSNNSISVLDIVGLNLKTLLCSANDLTDLNVTGSIDLRNLDCSHNLLTNLNITANNLEDLKCHSNSMNTLDVTVFPLLKSLRCENNNLTTLNFAGLANLRIVYCYENNLTSLDFSDLPNFEILSCDGNQFASLNVLQLTNLRLLSCSDNQLTSLNLSGLPQFNNLDCSENQITSLNISGLSNLVSLNVANNQLSNIDFSGLSSLTYLTLGHNLFTALDLSQIPSVKKLYCNNNQIQTLNISNLSELSTLYCGYNPISTLDFTGLEFFEQLDSPFTQLAILDFSGNPAFKNLKCNDNPNLEYINIKNGRNQANASSYFGWVNNPNLAMICVDNSEAVYVQNLIEDAGLNVSINSYCSFSPGGTHNTITGNLIYDSNANGCDANDFSPGFVKVNLNDGINQGSFFNSVNGNYSFYTGTGNFVVSPNVPESTWFSFDPTSAAINFVDTNNNQVTQNFCVSPVGVHPDVEVIIIPNGPARPGFHVAYTILYKNNGNQVLSGTVNFTYDEMLLDFISANLSPNLQNDGSLSWNYTSLLPFESRSVNLIMDVNTPTENPPVNDGDVLIYAASISPTANDETIANNAFSINHTVVNSLDPNDKICLEGNVVSPTEIGKYLHYVINFENIGTAAAQNVVVADMIDIAKFDIATLQMMHSSHPVVTRITGNKVEFIFENIQLQANEHGNVVFKIKTKSTLVANDIVTNKADIFFDYNFPIETNTATTVFQLLGTEGFEIDQSIQIYPNPTSDFVNIIADGIIKSIQLFDINGRILKTSIIQNTENQIDMSPFQTGIYYLKAETDKGIKAEKLIKK